VDQPDPGARTEAPACYLHPKRQALLRCSRCEQPICADDMIEAPVGYQCPRCAEGGQQPRRLVDAVQHAPLTRALVVTIGAVFVLTTVAPQLISQLGLIPVRVGLGAWWLLVSSAFVHANLMHVGFNGLLLWQLGHMLEPNLGRARYAALYAAGIAGGSLGVVLLSWVTVATPLLEIPVLGRAIATNPFGVTVGASGAVFALMGAATVGLRQRGINPWKTSIGTLVLLNLVLTFAIPGISVGGHVGGLLAGMVAGKLLFVERERAQARAVAVAGLAVAMFALSIVLAAAILT
jgi:membrane associated rhomboid family serine protease